MLKTTLFIVVSNRRKYLVPARNLLQWPILVQFEMLQHVYMYADSVMLG